MRSEETGYKLRGIQIELSRRGALSNRLSRRHQLTRLIVCARVVLGPQRCPVRKFQLNTGYAFECIRFFVR